jgi:hypothetical protein
MRKVRENRKNGNLTEVKRGRISGKMWDRGEKIGGKRRKGENLRKERKIKEEGEEKPPERT